MPGMDGIQTIRKMKAMDTEDVPPAYVLVTAYGRDDVLREAESADVDDILIKPLNPSQLFDSVVRVLRHRAGIADDVATERDNKAAAGPTGVAGRQVLVVEDNDLNRDVAIDLLQSVGLRVDTVENGALALEALEVKSYDAVLMDVQMPVMDGFTAAREYRRRHPDGDLPIIAMTANAMAGDRERCLDAGMNDHVAKPIDPDDLFAVLTRWLGGNTEAELTPPQASESEGAPAVHETVDGDAGMRRVLGRRDRYVEMLGRYADGQAQVADLIGDLLTAGDREAAEREAHTARAVAGNIGAFAVAACAETIEKAIQAGRTVDEIAPLTAHLRESIHPVIDGIHALPELTAREEPAPTDRTAGEITQILTQLRRLLDEDDAEAQDLLASERAAVCAAVGDRAFGPLVKAIQEFDFGTAREICARASADRQEGVAE